MPRSTKKSGCILESFIDENDARDAKQAVGECNTTGKMSWSWTTSLQVKKMSPTVGITSTDIANVEDIFREGRVMALEF
jgi:hypothetical protein